MNVLFKKRTFVFVLILTTLCCTVSVYGQEYNNFEVRYQNNLRGDLTFIGNNILNRDSGTTGERPNDAYNNQRNNNFGGTNNDNSGFFNFNDFKNMQYIDVDSDPTTFSSSTSTFTFEQSDCNLIRYAGLYWSATYPSATANGSYNSSGYAPNNIPVGTGRQTDFNQVKFRVPGGTYVDIIADEVIFDGFTSTDNTVRQNSPYACYADVTAMVTALANPEGDYTVANIRATTGGLTPGGGTTGGWTLVIVYENPSVSGKFITTFDGFARVNGTNSIDIDYSGFETIPVGPVIADLGAATLEGDFRIAGDGLSIEAASNTGFTPIGNATNPTNNFFNSNITLDGFVTTNRNPASTNTLGYDIDIFRLNNAANSIIPNGETAATFRFSTNGDQYYPFFNSFNVEIIEPNIVLEKRVEDIAGNDITGAGVNLGQLLDYVLTFENIGNDDATNYTIRDILPLNVTLIESDIILPPGVSYTYDPSIREIIFTIPDDIVEENDPSASIRLRVRVAENCFDFIDACTDQIANVAFSTYQGIINDAVITDDPSVNDFDACGFVNAGATNFLLDDLDSCDFSRTVQLCGDSVLLDAGNNFDAYFWYVDENNDGLIDAGDTLIPNANTDTLLVTEVGTYIVDKQVADPCKGFQEIITVTLFGTTQSNPITALINDTSNTVEGEIVVCPNDGEELPEIFLCGLNDTELIQINIPDADSIEWEQLDESSCSAATDDCANKNNTCTWNTVTIGNSFTASDAGQYRVVINYANGCFSRFYFNIFKNPLDPQFNSSDIICNTPGNITVTNLPLDYEFQLVDATNDNILVPYSANNGPSFDIASNGAYRVEMRQQGVVGGCVFVLDNIGILNRDFQVDVTARDTNCNGLGEVSISVLNVEAQYYYEISQGGTSLDTFGPSNDNNYTFENLNDGVYDILVTTDDGCNYTEQVTITDRADLDATARLTKNIDCEDGTITVSATGGFPNPDYAYAIWSFNGTDLYADISDIPPSEFQSIGEFTFTNGEEGDYGFVVIDSNNCPFFTNIATIGVSPAADFDTTLVQNANCFGEATGSITYSLLNSNGYTLTYYLVPTADFNNDNSSSNAGGITLTSDNADVSSAIATNNSGTFINIPAGDYVVVINQAIGNISCDFIENYIISEPAEPVSANVVLIQDYTCTQDAIIAAENVTGGTAPYSYSIDGINFIPDTTPNANQFENLVDGTYTITVRDTNGCEFIANSITIDPLNPPTDLTFTASNPTCPSLTSDVIATAVGGNAPYSFEIVTPATVAANSISGNSANFDGLAPNTYTFRVTDAKNCVYEETFTIAQPPQITVSGQLINNISCFSATDGEARFNVSNFVNSFDYSINGPSNFSGSAETNSTIDIANLDDGIYTITVTDNDTNCTATSSVQINAPPAALAISNLDITDLTCSTSGTVPGAVTITAVDGWGSYEYELEDPSGSVTGPQNTNTFSGLTDTSGNYTVTVTDAGGCEISQTFNLSPTVSPVLDVTANNLCYDSSVGLELTATVTSGGVAPFQYRLNGSGAYQSSPVFTGLGSGSYTVEVIDSRNCTATASIDVFPTLTANASLVKDLDCSVSPAAEISISIAGGNPSFTYEVFLNGSSFQANTPVASVPFSYFTTTPGDYTFTITDSESCSVITNQVVVTDNPLPTVTPVVTDVLCNGEANGTVDLNVSGGLAPYTIVFDGSAASAQEVYIGLSAGTYNYTVTDAKDCVTTASVTVGEPSILSLITSIAVDYTCDANATIDVTATNGGTAPYSYSIDGVNFSGTSSFPGLTDGTYTITVRDANNCVQTSTQTIAPLNPPTNLSFAQTALTCPTLQSDVTVSVTGGNIHFIYEIIAPSGSAVNNGNNATFSGLTAGTYTFRVTDDKNCFITEDYTIDDIPQVDAVSQLVGNVTCVGDTDGAFNFTVSDFDTTYSYVVLDGLGATVTSANTVNVTTAIAVTGLGADTYVINVTDDTTNCTVSINQTVAEPVSPLAFTFTNTDDTCIDNATVTVTATGGWGNYEYQLEDTAGPTIIYPYQGGNSFADVAPGTYTIYVRDANGCIVDQSMTIDPAETPAIALGTADLCYDTTDQASLTINITDGVAPYSYTINGGGLIATGGNPFTINNLTPGTYNIQVTDAYGCVSNVLTQSIEPQLTANAILAQDLFCTANAIIDVTIGGGYTPYATYQVQVDGAGYGATTAITGNSFTYNGAATAGTYQFLITDNNGCTVETNEVTVSPTVTPQATEIVTDAACFGFGDGSVLIDIDESFGVAPFTISFNGSTFTNTRTYSGLTAGTYPYIVRDSRMCEFTGSATVTEPLEIISNMTSVDVTCDPATRASVLGSVIVDITQGGVANFTYTLYDSTNAIVDAVVSASTTHTFANLDFGDYYVRIIDANGCESDLGSVRVSSNPFLTLTDNPLPSDCITGGTVEITASGGSGDYDFEIYDGGPGPSTEVATAADTEIATFTGLNPGQTYIIRAVDTTNGCVSFLEVNIPPVSAISVVVDTTTDVTCVAEDDGIVTFTVDNYDATINTIDWEILNSLTNTPVAGPGTYTGSIGPGPAGGPQTGTVTQIPPGDYVLVVREASAPSCTTTTTFRITEPSATAVMLTSQVAGNCFADAEVSVRASGGTTPYTYAYVVAGGSVPTVFPEGQTFTLDPTISLTWDIYAQDANGCVSLPLGVAITVDDSPEITTALNNACTGDEGSYEVDVTLDAVGIGPYRISVDGGAPEATALNAIGDAHTITGLSSGNHTIQILDANGCGETENITIFPPLEVLANVTTDENCDPANTGEVTITANGGSGVYTFTQTSPAGASNATGLFTGLTHSIAYTFEVEDDNTNCIVPVTITLPSPMVPTFNLEKIDVSCFSGNDGTITVDLDPGNVDIPYLFSLDGGTTTQTSNVFTGLVQGTYNITVISDKGCEDTQSITINEPTELQISASASAFTCDDAVSTITATIDNDGLGNPSGTSPYLFSFNGGSFSTNNTFAIAYGSPNVAVVVRDDNGCEQTTSVAVPAMQEVTAVIAELQDINCDNGEEIIEINASNGSGNYIYTQLPSGNVVADPTNIIITAPGTYVYEVTDTTTNCSVVVEHIVDPYDLIEAVATVTSNATCSDSVDGTIDVTITGYTGTFDYEVLDNGGNAIAGSNDSDNATSDPYTFTVSTSLGAGTYTVSITETADPLCATETNPITIMAPQPLELLLVDNISANCNQADAIVTVRAAGGTAPYTYGASQSGTGVPITFPFDDTIELNLSTATDWDIYVRDVNGCIISAPLAVTIATDTTPDITLAIVDECASQGNFAITVALDATNTGVAPYRLSLNGGAFESITSFTHTYSNLNAGNHTVEIRDVNGCGEIENITIAPELQITSTPNTQPTCGTSDGIVDFTVAGGSGSSTVRLLRTDFSDTGLVPVGNQFTGVAFGDYIVRVTDTSLGTPNCFADAAVSLEEPTPVTLLATRKTDISCAGETDGTITISLAPTGSGVNDNPPYVYEITDGTNTFTQNNGLFENLAAGTYDITVRSNRNCIATDRITIDVPTALNASITNVIELSCDIDNGIQSASLEVTIDSGTGTPDYFYSVNGSNFIPTGGNVFTYTTTNSGNFDVVIRDANGCLFSLPTQTIAPLNTFSVGLTATPITCLSDEQVVLNVTESNPTGHTYTFELLPLGNPAGNFVSNTATTATFDLNTPGSYTFRATNDVTGCYEEYVHVIAPYDLIEVNAVATTPVTCFNDNTGELTITISGYSGGYDYEVFTQAGTSVISGNGTTSTLLIGGLNGGNYYVTVTETDATSTFCSDNSNIVTIVSPNAALLATPSIIAPATCTDDQGAIAISVEGGYAPYNITLAHTTNGQTYTINDVLIHTFTGLASGTYDITVIDDNNCIRTYSETIAPAIPVTAGIAATPLLLECFGDTNAMVSAVSVLNGSGSYQYQLNEYANLGDTVPINTTGLQNSPDFNNLGAGIYSITVVDGWNCDVTTSQVQIQEPTEIMPSLVQSAQVTCTTNASLMLTATQGTAPYYYYDDVTSSWQAFNNGNSHVFNNVTPGNYQFAVRDDNDCEVPLSNQISVDPVPPLTIDIDDSAAFINCTGEASATIVANVAGGLGNYSFELFADAALSNLITGPQSNNTFSGLPAGAYYVRVTSQDCEEVSGETIIVDPAPLQIDREEFTDISCFGLEDGTITVEVSGGTGEILYAITPNLNQFDTVNTFDDLGPGVYDIIAQDRNGCFMAFEFTINQPQLLDVDTLSIVNEICEGDEDGSIEIEISGGTAPYSAAFNSNADADFVANQTVFDNLGAGTYVIFVRDAQGCEQNIIVDIESGVNLNAIVAPIYECSGDVPDNSIEVTLEDENISADVLYGLDSNPLQLAPDFTNMAPGMHTLTIAHANGCLNVIDFEIQDFEPLTLLLEQNNINEITATASGGLEEYTFYFDGDNNGSDNTYIINRTDMYTVRVVDANGCEAIAQIEVEFIDIEFPNFFTPDGDGTNDLWIPNNIEGFPEILIIIYDRYGRRLDEMSQDHRGWDGKYQGHDLPTGDYWYVIKLQGENDDREFVGHFTLYR